MFREQFYVSITGTNSSCKTNHPPPHPLVGRLSPEPNYQKKYKNKCVSINKPEAKMNLMTHRDVQSINHRDEETIAKSATDRLKSIEH